MKAAFIKPQVFCQQPTTPIKRGFHAYGRASKYLMRIQEITTKTVKPLAPLTPEKARISALKQSVERTRELLHTERERQHQQREAERKRKQQQRSSLA